jgi:Flp pilus assembly protein TadG
MNQRKIGPLSARSRRRGAALVEFAVCLPVIMILILGSMEATSAVFVRQALTTSAYEGIREAIRIDSTASTALSRAQSVLTARQIRDLLPLTSRTRPEARRSLSK